MGAVAPSLYQITRYTLSPGMGGVTSQGILATPPATAWASDTRTATESRNVNHRSVRQFIVHSCTGWLFGYAIPYSVTVKHQWREKLTADTGSLSSCFCFVRQKWTQAGCFYQTKSALPLSKPFLFYIITFLANYLYCFRILGVAMHFM